MNTNISSSIATRLMVAAACALGIAFSSLAVAADSLERIKSEQLIRIANTQTSPPWSMLGDDNKPTGYDVAMARELAKRMGIAKVVFTADTYKNFVSGLKTGKYDLVMNDLTPTAERMKQIDFSVPYGVEQFRIFVHKNNTDIVSRATLAGKRVGVSSGSSNETWSRANLRESDIRTYDNGSLIFNDLAIGRIDAVIISHFGGMRYAEANKVPTKEVGEPLTYQLAAAGLAKDQPELLAAVNKALESMLADGTVARLSAQFVGEDYKMMESIAKAKAEAAAAKD
ncbi:transporter substrate-binding domain-containing protein [Pollutimonas sp. M17]|uniref:transporter substrate-binding domain-containing protein n=1 Tax=Pollutimonas sp. M17 TaxID=2962065 RepID=UPI0021F42294|nr:transporter substrate-binding domain-containing protein [Pollutimonas sp. M17]UYO93200.1 transporter substrate-binding domain-containing protein [Pollutimonas sp. M17]